ncbi:hypothetical protein FORC065_2846 [Yersinia enterocolitica]|nr:hypothetical protein FORC065_2846 [Yersinia enterocolitica]
MKTLRVKITVSYCPACLLVRFLQPDVIPDNNAARKRRYKLMKDYQF